MTNVDKKETKVRAYLESVIKSNKRYCEQAMERFQARLSEDPLEAMRWNQESAMKGEFKKRVWDQVGYILKNSDTLEKFSDELTAYIEEYQSDVFKPNSGFHSSTCPMTNLLTQWEMEVRLNFLSTFGGSDNLHSLLSLVIDRLDS